VILMANSNEKNNKPAWRDWLALSTIFLSILSIAVLAVVVIFTPQQKETSQLVFSSLLPLCGSWVGTILAYYFSKENFESASRSVSEIAKQMITSQDKLKSLSVLQVMKPRTQIFYKQMPLDQCIVSDVLTALKVQKKGKRLPILNASYAIIYMIHQSSIDHYLALQLLNKNSASAQRASPLTLQDLLNESEELKHMFESSFAVVSSQATLADAKQMMDLTPSCQDVFVTLNGHKDEPVLGWITNVDILEHSRI